jgi:hypothetical protein
MRRDDFVPRLRRAGAKAGSQYLDLLDFISG